MTKDINELRLAWGCLCDPISKQLREQGIELPEATMQYVDKLKDACNILTTIIPNSVADKIYQKSHKRVMEIVMNFMRDGKI